MKPLKKVILPEDNKEFKVNNNNHILLYLHYCSNIHKLINIIYTFNYTVVLGYIILSINVV